MGQPSNCPSEIFSSTFIWDSVNKANVSIKIHCISTEFTQKRRGGERGVPFRLHCDIYPWPLITNSKYLPDFAIDPKEKSFGIHNRSHDDIGVVRNNHQLYHQNNNQEFMEQLEKKTVARQLLYSS